MIYKGLNRVGAIGDIKTNGGGEIAEVYGGIGDSNPIYYKQRDMVGTSPMQFKALGLPLKDYHIYGETRQDGTPSPDMPVDVVGCGAKTGNLFDKDNVLENYYLNNGVPAPYNIGGYVLSDYIPIASNTATISAKNTTLSGLGAHWAVYDENKTFIRGGISFDAYKIGNIAKVVDTSGAAFIRVDYATQILNDCMLNSGSTALPYEPYGYKLPVTTTNGTDTVSTPIYIGSEPLHRIGEYADYVDYSSGKIVRKIKKLELTGEEEYKKNYPESTSCLYYASRSIFPGSIGITPVICNELPVRATAPIEAIGINTTNPFPSVYFNFGADIMNAQPSGNTVAGLKEYLAAQYAAGTPVTVWYVLETPTEEDPPVPFPELTTLSGTNTLTVDTTVKPSEIDLTGRIKTSGYGQLLDKNLTAINDSTGMPIFIRG